MKELTKKYYPRIQETIYHSTLQNGLRVFLVPNHNFHETYAILSVQFGTIDSYDNSTGETKKQLPAGLAHFLEHKMFEGKDGEDALQRFAVYGAEANAYTSFRQTNYTCSTSEDIRDSLCFLQRLTSELSISEESVLHEKQIIEQEIKLYQDDPSSRLYLEILASLYPQSSLAYDIVGSVDSIASISVELLQGSFDYYYTPNRQILLVAGNFDIEGVSRNIQDCQISLHDCKEVLHCRKEGFDRTAVAHFPVLKNRSTKLEVAMPKLAVGIRGKNEVPIEKIARYQLCLSLLFSMLIGSTSTTYHQFYEERKIDPSFSFDLEIQQEYRFFILTVDTLEPITVSSRIQKIFQEFESHPDVNEQRLELVKKEHYGRFINQFNSLETVATEFIETISDDFNLFDIPELLESTTLSDVKEIGRDFMDGCDMTDFIIFPQ